MIKDLRANKDHSILRFNLGSFMTLFYVVIIITSCTEGNIASPQPEIVVPPEPPMSTDQRVEGVDYFLPHIDLNNWKVTLPIGNPSEVEPPEILNYADDSILQNLCTMIVPMVH